MMQCDVDINHEIINVREDIIDERPLRDDSDDEFEGEFREKEDENTSDSGDIILVYEEETHEKEEETHEKEEETHEKEEETHEKEPEKPVDEDHELVKKLLKDAYEDSSSDDIIDIRHPMKLENVNRNLPKKVQKEEESDDIYTYVGELIAVYLIKLDAILFNAKVKTRRFIRKSGKNLILFLMSCLLFIVCFVWKFFL